MEQNRFTSEEIFTREAPVLIERAGDESGENESTDIRAVFATDDPVQMLDRKSNV